jgi:dihydroorotase
MLRAMRYASMFDRAILQHCQDDALAGSGVMNSGYWATTLGLPGISALAEELMLYRDIQLARLTRIRYHAQHLSTRGSVEIVRQTKSQGNITVTAEVTPHHLLLTEESCASYDTNFKVNPPLRSRQDVDALLQGVADGTIDCLATDHAPHLLNEKELEFLYAPFGIASLECALGLFVKALIEPGVIDWPHLVEMLTINPARICRLEKGTLSPGADADITLIDPQARWRVDTATWRSKARNCPYNGWELTARPVATIVAGQIRHQYQP